VAARPDPGDPDVGDPRSYLYVELDKQTAPAPTRDGSLGVAVEVRLHGHPSDAAAAVSHENFFALTHPLEVPAQVVAQLSHTDLYQRDASSNVATTTLLLV